jgi:hypothetical protein
MQKSKCKTGNRFPSFDYCILTYLPSGQNPPQPRTAAEVNRARFWLRPMAAAGKRGGPFLAFFGHGHYVSRRAGRLRRYLPAFRFTGRRRFREGP